MKKILLLATGGTIASKKEAHGLKPVITSSELLTYIPQIEDFCEVDGIQLFSIDSTDIRPYHWEEIVKTIRENYESYDGFVIAHGTDTMAYTAAALSYMIQNSPKPIVITGSQKPIDLEITDAKTNLIASFLYASDDRSQGVQIVFDGKVIAGTRAKKVRSKSFNAFSSIDYPFLALVQDDTIIRYIPMLPYEQPVCFYDKMEDSVFLLKLTPGIKPYLLEAIFKQYKCVVVESFGVGGIPNSMAESFYEICEKHPDNIVVMATQVTHEGSDMTVYEVGQKIKFDCNFLESYDMTLESVLAKMMWILANFPKDIAAVEEAFYKSVNYDVLYNKHRKPQHE